MTQKTKIQWSEYSWNPYQGCHKISEGCKFCYMYRDKTKYGQNPNIVIKSKDPTFYKPLKIKEPSLIFTCSWSDFFIKEADKWRNDVWKIIKDTPRHTYQILTKRPERILECLPDDWGNGYHNVWLGISAENEERLEERLDTLLNVPAHIRFLSLEPLLDYINLQGFFLALEQCSIVPKEVLHWIIIGGESGYDTGKFRYRECKTHWIESIAYDCQRAQIPVFVKQLGSHLAKELNLKDWAGGNIDEFPDILKIRQMPEDESVKESQISLFD